MLHGLTGWHLIILLAVVLLLFGATKLPALAKSVGQSARVFKGEMKAMKEDEAPAPAPSADHSGLETPTAAEQTSPSNAGS